MNRSCLRVMLAGFCIVAVLSASQGAEKWELEYDGSVLPSDAADSWGVSLGTSCTMTITPEGYLHIVDGGSVTGALASATMSWGAGYLVNRQVAEARVRTVTCSGQGGVSVLVANGVYEEVFTLFPDRIETHRSARTYAMDTTDDFHTYRFEAEETDFFLYADGNLVIDGSDNFTSPSTDGRNTIRFGSQSSGPTSDAYWDFVRYTVFPFYPPEGAINTLVHKDPDYYSAFPSLYEIPGDPPFLFASFTRKVTSSHITPDGTSKRMFSYDGGYHWQETTGNYVCPAYADSSGVMVRANARGWRYTTPDQRPILEARGLEVRDVGDQVAYAEGAYAQRSTNGGQSWTTTDLDGILPPLGLLMTFSAPCSYLRVSDEVVLSAVYGRPTAYVAYYEAFVLRTDDNGVTWDFVNIGRDLEQKVSFGETALAKMPNGDILAMMRNDPSLSAEEHGYLYMARSSDNGLTWSMPEQTPMWGYPAHLLVSSAGDVICSYGYRRTPMGVHVVVSRDHGRTWDIDNLIVLRRDGANGGSNLGYPITVETSRGQFFTIYYFTAADAVTHIAGTHWSLGYPFPADAGEWETYE
ncbi:exo-alpha-sialidase [bacterium]|nr:exo-alpha-sialidase [bacterium]